MSLNKNTEIATNTRELEISVDGATFDAAINKVFKKNTKDISIHGFRKGKATRAMVENIYGAEVFYDDAMQECYPEALAAAADEADIKIVAVDTIEAIDAGKDGFTFKATVIVEPTIEIDGYKGIEVTSKPIEVTDDDITAEINRIRDRNSRMVTVEGRAAQNGDTAVIDFEGFLDGVAFEGGKGENFNLALGSGQFIPGFEEQICGHNAGDEFSIFTTFPEDYQAEELAGKETEFKIKLHEIKIKEIPELDDEFVKDVSDKNTVEEYKEEVSQIVKTRFENDAKADRQNQILNKTIELVKGEIPEAMYENQVRDMLNEFDMRLRQQGMDINTYMQNIGTDVDGLKAIYRPEAERRVKLRLALERIAQIENIEVTAEDIDNEYSKIADMYKMEVEKVKAIINSKDLANDIKTERAMELLEANAVIK